MTAPGDRIRPRTRETEVLAMGDNPPRFDLPSRLPNDDEWTAQRFKVAVGGGRVPLGYRLDTACESAMRMPLTGGLMQ